MGQVYYLEKADFTYSKKLKNNLVLKEILTEEEATDLIEIQNNITNEITEPINILQRASLCEKNPLRAKGLMFCLAIEDNKVIGYGYGYFEENNENYYLDAIGVNSDYRGQEIGQEIKICLINYAFEHNNIRRIKAITQDENVITKTINKKLGFKLKEIDQS